MNQDNIISNLSYTSKDFEAIYPELLDLVKELTYKWDPSISNESDPGVVLLKLNAIIADKCNYNIDKNVLECFPASVTQQTNARQLFEQLGYYMHWYKSATTSISMKWSDSEHNASHVGEKLYTIPKFTTVSDYNNNIIYTLVGPADGTIIEDSESFVVGDMNLSNNETPIVFKAIQGVPVQYSINNSTTITPANLDSNNRLYFTRTDIAENGIFITNISDDNFRDATNSGKSCWARRDNLLVENLGQYFYKFGVTLDGLTSYLEFPEDAETLFRDGINIWYITTNGEYGNVAAKTVERFYADIQVNIVDSTDTAILNSENVVMYNLSAASDGCSMESIEDAYRNYKRTVGTFKTLVTLRDYINAILNTGILASNGFVCDRTNDIQNCYSIITKENEINQTVTEIETTTAFPEYDPNSTYLAWEVVTYQGEAYACKANINTPEAWDGSHWQKLTNVDSDTPILTAFSLKLYLLQYVADTSYSASSYNNSFKLINNADIGVAQKYINDQKSMQHDFRGLDVPYGNYAHVCFFKNKYPLSINIIPQYELTPTQIIEVTTNVKQALYKELSSKYVDFGEEILLDSVVSIIENADNRIKRVIVDNVNYTTYAVVYNEDGTFTEVEISSEDTEPVTLDATYAGEITDLTLNTETYLQTHSLTDYTTYTYTFDGSDWVCSNGNTYSQIDLGNIGITYSGTAVENNSFSVRTSLKTQIRDDIYTKSVLAGITPLFIEDTEFKYTLKQDETTKLHENIFKLSSDVNISLEHNSLYPSYNNTTYMLRDNESVQLFAPNLLDSDSYSDYVKFEYKIFTTISANSTHQLDSNEYIIFYWKTSDGPDSVFDYYLYGPGNIITPNFTLPMRTTNIEAGYSLVPSDLTSMRNIGTSENPAYVKNSTYEGDMDTETNEKVSSIVDSARILSNTRGITVKKVNEIMLDYTYKCYWITEDLVVENGVSKYRLFEANGNLSRILGSGEYFIYSNGTLSDFVILGSGTKITRTDNVNDWEVVAVDPTIILLGGIDSLDGLWHQLSGTTLKITENQFITVGVNSRIKLSHQVDYRTRSVYVFEGLSAKNPVANTAISIDIDKWNATSLGKSTTNTQYELKRKDDNNWYLDSILYPITDLESNFGITINIPSSTALYYIKMLDEWQVIFGRLGANVIQYPRYTDTVEAYATDTEYHIGDFVTNSGKCYKFEKFFTAEENTQWDDVKNDVIQVYFCFRQQDLVFNDFVFAYTSDGTSNTWVSVDGIDLNNQSNWEARSLLTINMNNENKQVLLSNQSVTYHYIDSNNDEQVGTIIGADFVEEYDGNDNLTDSYYPVCLLSTFNIETVGGEQTSTITIGDSGEIEYLKIYQFKEYAEITGLSFLSENIISIYYKSITPNSDVLKNINFSLPVGEYIIPVNNPNTTLNSLLFYLDGSASPLTLINSDRTEMKDAGSYFVYLPITNVQSHTLTIKLNSLTKSATVLIKDIFKYKAPDNISVNYFNRIQTLIKRLDINNKFDYTYSFSNVNAIENPLEAKSFLNANHIYNNFTICQLDTSNNTSISLSK